MDLNIMNFVQQYCHNSITDAVFPIITLLGNMGIIWLVIAFIMLFSKKYRIWGLGIIGSIALAYVLGDVVLKNIVCRPRPCQDFPNIPLLIKRPHSYSFPSGHSSSAFAATVVLWKCNRKFGISALILALLIAFSRIFLFVHYPTDVLAGAVIGIICALITCFILKKLQDRFSPKMKYVK